ncbi:uncharacterized protein MELLADRAFT_93294 [Melampsora larici-populina 98AG31]|uniref:Lactate/malate dehydrogenase C-terminal domain-containing protein n=1 Tax=Melampsora larici-populina (strain 98AG31 / pathotype 3-4-7) TaxID=747676 RepID=F4S4P0_MELLP|nr:uncharacterized protein MELLADRAFT_93294 [Melampsora larici-populina 98AG31]EGG00321.1 hypothetical protein MELLADRAFT_93294 [Melampsora larici-populina 98AG31]
MKSSKEGKGSATLSMAYAGFRFANSLIKDKWEGKTGVTEMAYIAVQSEAHISSVVEGLEYFAFPIELGSNGVEKFLPIINLSSLEK